jgi:lipid-A-disaccharide synthase
MLVVFPFEEYFYKKYDVNVTYVGHPLVTRIKEFLGSNPKEKKVFGSEKVITFLPGSRKDEINNHMPILIETAKQLSKEFDAKIYFSKAPGMNESVFVKFMPQLKEFILTDEEIYKLVLNSDLVFTKAGTSTVECALIGTPFLIFYKTFPINYHLLKPIVKVDRLGMINILSEEMVIKEFVQKDFTAKNLLLEANRILTDNDYRDKIKTKLKKIWDILGNENASANAAKIIFEELQ